MKSKVTLILLSSLILMVGYLSPVYAVTDAEIEALEKQIEQLEAEEKKQAKITEKKKVEAEAKRKAEQKRKAEAESEKKRLVELEKQRQEEQKRLTELELKRQEEEAKKRAEKEREEKYTLLITEAEQAVSNKDKELAISKSNEAHTLYPGDTVALAGVKEAEKLMDKTCYEVLGIWDYEYFIGGRDIFNEDGTIDGSWDKWECINSKQRLFRIYGKSFGTDVHNDLHLSEDGECLLLLRTSICYRRPGYKKK